IPSRRRWRKHSKSARSPVSSRSLTKQCAGRSRMPYVRRSQNISTPAALRLAAPPGSPPRAADACPRQGEALPVNGAFFCRLCSFLRPPRYGKSWRKWDRLTRRGKSMGRSVFETLTVLVADDSAQMRTLLDRLLQALGVGRIVTAADG